MRYSIIVPIYNGELFLDACVASVRMQRSDDWELLLIDDGSTDGSGAMADAWAECDGRISVFHQENRGQFFARQAGIDASRGEYLLFLDCDDRWEADCLTVLDSVIREDAPDLILFAGKIYENGEDSGRVIGRVSERVEPMPRETLLESLLSSHDLNSLCLKAFRRELFLGDTTDYSAFAKPRCGEDKARLLYPASRAERIVAIPNTLYQYHHRHDSLMNTFSFTEAERLLGNDMFALLRQYLPIWNMDMPEYRDLLDAYYLKTWLAVYYGLRRDARTVQERRVMRAYPWKNILYRSAFRYGAVRRLSARDRLRLLIAALRG